MVISESVLIFCTYVDFTRSSQGSNNSGSYYVWKLASLFIDKLLV